MATGDGPDTGSMGVWRSVYPQNPHRGSWLRSSVHSAPASAPARAGWRSSALAIAQGSGERHAGLDVHLHQARAWLRERVFEVRSQLLAPGGGARGHPVALGGCRNVEVG